MKSKEGEAKMGMRKGEESKEERGWGEEANKKFGREREREYLYLIITFIIDS